MDREELIRSLAQSVATPKPEKEDLESRFEGDSNTLYADKKMEKRIDVESKENDRHDFALEEKDFTALETGRRTFFLVRGKKIHVGDTLVFRETENFKPTGRMTIKIVDDVLSGVPGLEEGYTIASWK